MKNPPAPTAAFVKSVRLLLALHEFFVRAQAQSPEANAIRDSMEQPWYGMSDHEQHLVEQLSADLYTIGDRSVEARPGDDLWTVLGRACAAGEWMKVLVLLQEHPGLSSPAERAHLRGEAWLALGVPEAAILFIEDALRASTPPAPSPRRAASGPETPRGGPRPRFPRLRLTAEAA
jgi:hypothetical protein